MHARTTVAIRLGVFALAIAVLTGWGSGCTVRKHLQDRYGIEIPADVPICSGLNPSTCKPEGGGGNEWVPATNVSRPALDRTDAGIWRDDLGVAEDALRGMLITQVVGNTYSRGQLGLCEHEAAKGLENVRIRLEKIEYSSLTDNSFVLKFKQSLTGKLKAGQAPLDFAAVQKLELAVSALAERSIKSSMYYFEIWVNGRWQDFVAEESMRTCLLKAIREDSAVITGANGVLFVDTKTKFNSLTASRFASELLLSVEADPALKAALGGEVAATVEASFESAKKTTISGSKQDSPRIELGWVQFSNSPKGIASLESLTAIAPVFPQPVDARCVGLANGTYFGPVYFKESGSDRYIGVGDDLMTLVLGSSPQEWTLERGEYGSMKGLWITRILGHRRGWKLSNCEVKTNSAVGLLWNHNGQAKGRPENCELFALDSLGGCKVTIRAVDGEGRVVISNGGLRTSSSSGTSFDVEFPR